MNDDNTKVHKLWAMVALVTSFVTVVTRICGPFVWNVLLVPVLTPNWRNPKIRE